MAELGEEGRYSIFKFGQEIFIYSQVELRSYSRLWMTIGFKARDKLKLPPDLIQLVQPSTMTTMTTMALKGFRGENFSLKTAPVL